MRRFDYAVNVFGVGLSLVLLVACLAEAQQRGGGNANLRNSPIFWAGVEQIQAKLEISDQQKQQLSTISSQWREAVQALTRGLSQAERREKQAELRPKRQQANRESQAKIDAILNESQRQRLGEIVLQVRGPSALLDRTIAKPLNVTRDQRTKLTEIQSATQKKQRELNQKGRNGDISRREAREQINQLRKQADENRLAVLSDDQRAEFAKMQGEIVDLDLDRLLRRRRAN